MSLESLAQRLRGEAVPLLGEEGDYDALLEQIGDSRFVLLGEASHGTHEFYRERALITQRLIAEKGFTAVAVEADWPDAWRVNRFVRGLGDDEFASDALEGFRRFPTWMWRNSDVVNFVDGLRDWNDGVGTGAQKVGFYGLDLYSLHASMEAVLHYLDRVDPPAARRARERYGCFDRFGDDSQHYGFMTGLRAAPSCEEEVIAQLLDLQRHRTRLALPRGEHADEAFYAEQNARLVRNAERYYRTMYLGTVSSWNLRDQHMMETLEALVAHQAEQGQTAKVVLWAHNSHLGDARATEMGGRRGELNIGQLVRERYDDAAFLVGFTTHEGTVTAARDWDEPARRRVVRPARSDSYEGLFHHVGLAGFHLPLRGGTAASLLAEPRLERAIGVIYRPETERQSHYFEATLPRQFDAVLHFDVTRAVEPLERGAHWLAGEAPETYPSGM
ncbi:MAG TPA: erythromycin esterase family protein [Moraxellaceae bacterium]|nr:erythromycin esterase family protein [Moraxellaceae bacterium]